MADLDTKTEALLRASRHYRRTVQRFRRIVYGAAVPHPEVRERLRKQVDQAQGNLCHAAEAYAHAVGAGRSR